MPYNPVPMGPVRRMTGPDNGHRGGRAYGHP